MTTPTRQFFTGLFDEQDFKNLSRNTGVSLTVSTTAWVGNLCFPGNTGETSLPKSACFIIAVLAGGAAVYFALKREKPLRKKTVISAIEDNDFVQRSGVVTGLNAEKAVQHLQQCLKKEIET